MNQTPCFKIKGKTIFFEVQKVDFSKKDMQ